MGFFNKNKKKQEQGKSGFEPKKVVLNLKRRSNLMSLPNG